MKDELDVFIQLLKTANKRLGVCWECERFILIQFEDGKPAPGQENCPECKKSWSFDPAP